MASSEGSSQARRDLLTIETRVHGTSHCAHVTPFGFAESEPSQRQATAEKIRSQLGALRTVRNASLCFLTPGTCALPDSLLHRAAELKDTTALVLDA